MKAHLTPVTSTMALKFDSTEIKVTYLRCTNGEVCAMSALAPKIGPLALSPKNVGDGITEATSNGKGLRIMVKLVNGTDRPRPSGPEQKAQCLLPLP